MITTTDSIADGPGKRSGQNLRELIQSQLEYPQPPNGGQQYDKRLVLAQKPNSPYGKAIRQLRSNVLRKLPGGRDASIAVLGPAPSAEVSAVAANLAIALSQLGQSTLLVDGNLLDPLIGSWFRHDGEGGLVATLLGHRQPEDVLTRLPDFKDLSLIPSGPTPPNPGDVLNKSALGALDDYARNQFAMRIYNCTPLGEVTSAEMVADVCGKAICVVESGRSSYDRLHALMQTLERQGTEVLGAIVRK